MRVSPVPIPSLMVARTTPSQIPATSVVDGTLAALATVVFRPAQLAAATARAKIETPAQRIRVTSGEKEALSRDPVTCETYTRILPKQSGRIEALHEDQSVGDALVLRRRALGITIFRLLS
jgi:hypothetical protein